MQQLSTLRLTIFFYLLLFFSFPNAISAMDEEPKEFPKILKVGVQEDPPFVMKDEDGSFYGLSIDLWYMLAEELHLLYEFEEYEHTSAMLLGLSRKKIDLSINPMPVSGTRIRQLGVTHPFFTSSIGVAVRNAEDSQIQIFVSNIFSYGFIKLVMLLMMIVFGFGVLVWLAERKINQHEFRDGIVGIMDGIWWSTVTITTVGYGDKTPKTPLGRFISMLWMFAAISLISSFTATITSRLTVNQLEYQIENLEDLKKVKKIGTVNFSSSHDFLDNYNISTYKVYETPKDGMIALSKKEIDVFVYEKPVMKYLTNVEQLSNKLKIMPVTFNRHYFSLLMPKQSKLLDKINPELADKTSKSAWKRVLEKYNLHQ
ncbi:amino acid ABC transporter substrate-binding protein (PAAT family) [Sediminitomix flava]|uniref:Amino acid ABC transporter substrate-binding protein (PAAT family) n=2 Tax=Sediminitomix flava TaxID=379075 RepID=A0A315Z8E6_SEDFL|nr:amino acid ABC transporter substrate-binding protein (PAAT family) [Sediminitomix flava]